MNDRQVSGRRSGALNDRNEGGRAWREHRPGPSAVEHMRSLTDQSAFSFIIDCGLNRSGDRTVDKALLLAAAQSLARLLNDRLTDSCNSSIALERDEAVLALGYIEAAAEQLQKEISERHRTRSAADG